MQLLSADVLVRGGRVVDLDGGAEREADLRIRNGVITEVGLGLSAIGAEVVDAAGCWLIPGLWDNHLHFGQWARSTTWLDLSGTASPQEVCARVATLADVKDLTDSAHATRLRPSAGADRITVGFGYRSAAWARVGTVAELDAASGDRPVALISGDVHNGWLNSAALRQLGVPSRTGPLTEDEWFPVLARLSELPEQQATHEEEAAAVTQLAARGLVGIVDLEFSDTFRTWPRRVGNGIDSLRVRTGVYSHQLDEVISAGWHTGDVLPESDRLVTMGPLKVISDGSLSTRTAWCCEPYLGLSPSNPHRFGAPNLSQDQLVDLMSRAHAAGLKVAVHAIGDRANNTALNAFQATGAAGSIEHAQLLQHADVPRFASLELTASVQPHHLIDDREMTQRWWGDRADRTFMLRSLLDAGATLALGSDAPVSPPDPWLAMASAVHRSGDGQPALQPEQSLTAREAIAASVDGQRLTVGSPGDVVLLAANPLAESGSPESNAAALRDMQVHATICAGRLTQP